MAKIIDVVTFNHEYDLFRLRYEILKDIVDEFIVVQAHTTFSGHPKEVMYLDFPKVTNFIINEDYTEEEIKTANESPNTIGAEHWKREFLQKESIKKALTHLHDDDIVFIGDCDEIWDEIALKWCHAPFKLKLHVYTYFLNNHSTEQFWGTLVSPYKHIRLSCLNHLRSNAWKTVFYAGWHFTSLADGLKRKLEDSYTSDSYANPQVMEHLEENIQNNNDFLGRDFTYTIDESKWPQYLKEHKQDYIKLCK